MKLPCKAFKQYHRIERYLILGGHKPLFYADAEVLLSIFLISNIC